MLVNGASGIAVGMATNIPPHNLREVCDALIALDRDAGADRRRADALHPGPGLPDRRLHLRPGDPSATPIARAAASCTLRAKAEIETDEKSGRSSIIVTEIPFQVNKARLIERIAELVNERKLDGISDLRDESDREGMRIVIELKRDAVPEVVLNQLYKHTPLQESFGVNMLAIVDGRPQLLNLKDALQRLPEAPPRGRGPADDLRAAQGRGAAPHPGRPEDRRREPRPGDRHHPRPPPIRRRRASGLMDALGLSQIQAQAVLDMRLQRLTGLERDKIIAEYAEVEQQIARLPADPRRRARGVEDHRRGAPRDPREVRRRAAHADRRRGGRHLASRT